MAYPDDVFPDASTFFSGFIGAAWWNTWVVAPLNAIRSRILGVGPVASGTTGVNVTTANTPASTNITFPTGRFTVPPVVIPVAVTATPGSVVTGLSVTAVTTSGATIWANRSSTGGVSINWFAAQTS